MSEDIVESSETVNNEIERSEKLVAQKNAAFETESDKAAESSDHSTSDKAAESSDHSTSDKAAESSDHSTPGKAAEGTSDKAAESSDHSTSDKAAESSDHSTSDKATELPVEQMASFPVSMHSKIASGEVEPVDLDVITSEDVAVKEPVQKKERKHRHLALKIVGVLVAIILIVCAGATMWLINDDNERVKYAPANTVLDGSVNLTGMTRDEVRALVYSRAEQMRKSPFKLKLDGKYYIIKRSYLGKADVDATVEEAFAFWGQTTQVQRCIERVTSFFVTTKTNTYDVTTVYNTAQKKLKKKIKSLAELIDIGAVNAGYTYSAKKNKLLTTKSKTGIKVEVKKTVEAILTAVKNDASVTMVDGVYKILKPEKTKAGRAIYVDTKKCILYLYVNGKVKVRYKCTPGQKGYETPKGNFYIAWKDPSPVWVNPGSDWAKDMPDTIAAGEDNPLGRKALALSCGNGIYIHGTTNVAQLGTRASHGCIRVANANIVKLYDMVEENDSVFIR